jgi:hypothetical protein
VDSNVSTLIGTEAVKNLVVEINEGLEHLLARPGVSGVVFACKTS